MDPYKKRRGIRVLGAVALMGGAATGLVGLGSLAVSGPAGAVNNNPVGNPTSPAVSYESDCTSSLEAGEAAPFSTSTVINTTEDSGAATGSTFGIAGSVSETLVGPIVAGVNGSVIGPSSFWNLQVTQTFGSTDGTATGTYTYTTPTFANQTDGGAVSSASWGNASTTLTGDFSGATVGDSVSGTGIPSTAVITVINGTTSATISAATTAAGSGKVGYGHTITFTDNSMASPATAFTTNGTPGGKASVGIIGTTSVGVVTSALTIGFGGAEGVGTANCLLTGWQSTNPGPVQTFATTPQFPPGTLTDLVAASGGAITQPGTTQAITPEAGAYVNLNPNPPTANPASYNLGNGATVTETLPVTPGTDPVGGCNLVSGPGDADNSVTINNTPSTCTAHITNSGSTPETDTFTYNAYDNQTPPNTGNTATVTLHIGTPPVDQEIGQQVNAGQLVVSCQGPGTSGYPTNTLLTCPIINLPAITLNGVTQTTTDPANTIYVSDSRGDPTSGWTLTSYMVPTSSNTNPACSSVAAFCNQSTGSGTGNAVISGSELAISVPVCADYTGNTNPVTPGPAGNYGGTLTLCSTSAGTSGGTFTYNTAFTLTIPPSVFAGQYYGTVEYLVTGT